MKETTTNGILKNRGFQIRRTAMVMSLSLFFNLGAAMLNANGSELLIDTWNNSAFIVELDQERVMVKGRFYIDGLQEGQHRIKILQTQVNMHNGKKRTKVLYNGFINIPKLSRTVAKVQPNYRLEIVSRTKLKPVPVVNNGCHIVQTETMYDDYNHYEPITYDNDEYCDIHNTYHTSNIQEEAWCPVHNTHHNECPPAVEISDCTGMDDYLDHDDYSNYYDEMDLIMNENSFANLLLLLEDEWFDSRKLTTAKQAIKNNTLSSEQVHRLLEIFVFESSKLEIAKYAYEYTIDKQNYYLVFSALTYNSSVKELELWINEMEY